MLYGYDWEYLGLLDRDADGMAVWTCGENMTVVTHPSDTTMRFFLDLVDGVYGERVKKKDHVLVVVNAFWSGNGGEGRAAVGARVEEKGRRGAGAETGDWEKVYVARRVRSAAGRKGRCDARGRGGGSCSTRRGSR